MNNIVIALDETHHLANNKPLYAPRFDQVQSFHFPCGYAPVVKNQRAFFINTEGGCVFERTFHAAFGFYDGIAAVSDQNGFFHIDTAGAAIHAQHFLWSGNFQENKCAVQASKTQRFFHIDRQGDAIYPESYAYVGDYRYGIAVVVSDNGLSTHVDEQGKLLHQHYFLELDVYHKGYAIAKDEAGYFHIDKAGNALYQARYAKLEPFYNHRAVAVDKYGVKSILSSTGQIQQTIDGTCVATKKIEQYYANRAFSYWFDRILTSVLELNILPILAKGATVDAICQATNLPQKSAHMLLHWLRIYRFIDGQDGIYTQTLSGKIVSNSLKPIFLYWQSKSMMHAAFELTQSLKNQQQGFTNGYPQPFFDYLQTDRELSNNFEQVMRFYAVDYRVYLSYLAMSNERVCDVGGGNGALLTQLKQCYPNIKPMVLDKFHYDIAQNIEFGQIDFFEHWQYQSDVFLLSRVLHDWNDDKAAQILTNIARNMDEKSTLYVFEALVDENNLIDNGVSVSFHLLALLGGKERTLDEFKTLFQRARLRIQKVELAQSSVSLMRVIKL